MPDDPTEAVRLFRLAADQGGRRGQFNLAFMYLAGECVVQNEAKAARYFCLAAEQKDDQAQDFLGMMYVMGEGVAQDFCVGICG